MIRLNNCPFHHLARQHTELICGMNRAMVTATTRTIRASYQVKLDPADDRCCVVFEPSDQET